MSSPLNRGDPPFRHRPKLWREELQTPAKKDGLRHRRPWDHGLEALRLQQAVMMRIEPEISRVSIVLVGSFNPPIFHPEWFASHRLISDREREAAEVEIIHREIALFRMMGINRLVHFSVGDEGVRNRLGQKLAPHEPWGEWAAALAGKSARKRGGLRSLTMVQRDLDDRNKGRLQARIEPSIKIKLANANRRLAGSPAG